MASERQLSTVLSEFARTMVTEFPIQGILDRLVERIVEILPVTAAGVTLISATTKPRYIAASNGSALRFEQLQTELDDGPCLAAYRTGAAVSVPDLSSDGRFKAFAPQALDAGLAAVFTFPLNLGPTRLGALDLYRDTPGDLDDEDMAAAQVLAEVAAAYIVNAQARADLQDSSDRSRHSAMHDALTGLPNRVLFLERLEHALLRSRRSGKKVAILFADLDRFKAVNDTHGHQTGDNLLRAVTDRLSGLLRPDDTLGRLSGDEFVILCEDLDEESQAELIAMRIIAALTPPFELDGVHVAISVSVGIAFAGKGDQVPQNLLQDADMAMYQVKRKGGAHHQVIDLREQHLAEDRANLRRDLVGALERHELRVEYQPIVSTAEGRVDGVEALLRWDHPIRGLIPPTTIVPLAEQSGLIGEVGRWVLDRACADRFRWASRLKNDLGVAVNVSAQQLMAPDFVANVAAGLSSFDTPAELVTLEITESVFVQDARRAVIVLRDLKRLGVRLALDDFGTGYSSLSYLKRFPIDIVKIDQGFVEDVAQDRSTHAIVAAVVELAHALDMAVVTEGVENAEQRDEVAALGSESCQGFYFARPMSAASLEALSRQAAVGFGLRLPVSV
jgi:diguanylate cyclase (GGDEF)-like protein